MDINLPFEWGFFFTAKIETGHCIYTRCIRVILKLKKKNKYVLPYSAPFSDKAGTTLTDRVGGGGHMGTLGVGVYVAYALGLPKPQLAPTYQSTP